MNRQTDSLDRETIAKILKNVVERGLKRRELGMDWDGVLDSERVQSGQDTSECAGVPTPDFGKDCDDDNV